MELERVIFALGEDWDRTVDLSDDGKPVTRREYEQIDDFAAAIGAGTGVTSVVQPIPSVPSWARSIVLCDPQDVARVAERWQGSLPEAAPYIFLMNAPLRPDSIREVQRLGCAGAIEEARYRVWRGERTEDPDGGVCGRKEVATAMGAGWRRGAWSETDDYCFLLHEGHHGLPALLAAYLLAYSAML